VLPTECTAACPCRDLSAWERPQELISDISAVTSALNPSHVAAPTTDRRERSLVYPAPADSAGKRLCRKVPTSAATHSPQSIGAGAPELGFRACDRGPSPDPQSPIFRNNPPRKLAANSAHSRDFHRMLISHLNRQDSCPVSPKLMPHLCRWFRALHAQRSEPRRRNDRETRLNLSSRAPALEVPLGPRLPLLTYLQSLLDPPTTSP
jgi:hypothetical protein